MLIPLADLKARLHELAAILIQLKGLDGRAWIVDPTRLPTSSSVSKEYPRQDDPEAAFCGYPDSDGALQPGYSWLFGVDFKTELPFAICFAGGSLQDSPLFEDVCQRQPELARFCQFGMGDAGHDAVSSSSSAWSACGSYRSLPKTRARPRSPRPTWPAIAYASYGDVRPPTRPASSAATPSNAPTAASSSSSICVATSRAAGRQSPSVLCSP